MSLGFRWALVILIIAYGLSALAAVDNFNELIDQSTHEQNKISAEIHSQLQIKNHTTFENASVTKSASLKNLKLRVIKLD